MSRAYSPWIIVGRRRDGGTIRTTFSSKADAERMIAALAERGAICTLTTSTTTR